MCSFGGMTLDRHRLFTPSAMARVDQDTISAGVSGQVLMERAGCALARLCQSLRGPGRVNILCGPGNNGGDGYVAARYLKTFGWSVSIWSLVDVAALKGDALKAAQQWGHPVQRLSDARPSDCAADICIDALFGAGLNKALSDDLEGPLIAMTKAATTRIAVDLPSGVSGADGQDLGQVYERHDLSAHHTITFGAHKFGHVLEPGKTICGAVWIADIGINETALETHSSGHLVTAKTLTGHPSAFPKKHGHKYARGHLAVLAGNVDRAGAAQLAASAGLRTGAGLVTIVHQDGWSGGSMAADNAIMHAACATARDLPERLFKRKASALVAGPGLGLDERALEITDALLDIDLPAVFDADCLTLIAREGWHKRLKSHHVITPHGGEFARLFPDLHKQPRLQQALAASDHVECVLCLKGPDTIIVGSGPEVYVNGAAPAWLATAGSGDVLAGCIGALLSVGTAAHAAAGGVYLHSQAALALGAGLIAGDLPRGLQIALAALSDAPSFDKGA